MDSNVAFQKHFFRPVCNEAEIERIFNVENSADFLLKLRAETIIDHMRLFRVYRNMALAQPEAWSLESSFDATHFDRFIDCLSPDDRRDCENTTFGNMFSNDPNGSVFTSEYGPVITISNALTYFLKFAHLTLLRFPSDVPYHVQLNGLRIAIRVMMKTEALDFLMDPRGKLPPEIEERINVPLSRQMQFIAGHEVTHLLLGHLSESRTSRRPVYFAISADDNDYKPVQMFNSSQQEEFDADLQAILLPQYQEDEVSEILQATVLWFGALELYETVSDAIFPRSPHAYRTHPMARERIDNLLARVPTPKGFGVRDIYDFHQAIDGWKQVLLDDVSSNLELYERYGSVYLDAPNSEWRGPELIDRVDYY